MKLLILCGPPATAGMVHYSLKIDIGLDDTGHGHRLGAARRNRAGPNFTL